MRKKRRRSAAPIYIFLVIWLLFSLGMDVSTLAGLLITAGVSVLAAIGAAFLLNRRKEKKEAEIAAKAEAEDAANQKAREKEKEAASPYSPEVQSIIREGRVAMKEMGRSTAPSRTRTSVQRSTSS